MKSRALCTLAMAGAFALCAIVSAQSPTGGGTGPNGSGRVTENVALGATVNVRSASIIGAAWNADNTPIPFAKLRLRNVVSGRIQAHTVADELGKFAFRSVEPGSFVVELVSDDGRILTVGHTFSAAPGETVATFVRLGTKVPWFNGFFGNAAAIVASTAAAAGVTALAPEEMTCVSACGG
jgi:hypothetical protein